MKNCIEERLPECGTTEFENCAGNLLDPRLKGLHLLQYDKLEETKESLEENLDASLNGNSQSFNESITNEIDLSPMSRLRKKLTKKAPTTANLSKFQKLFGKLSNNLVACLSM